MRKQDVHTKNKGEEESSGRTATKPDETRILSRAMRVCAKNTDMVGI